MRAILVPADGTPIRRIDLHRDGDSSLDALQQAVGGSIEAHRYPDRDDVTCYGNEEALLIGAYPNLEATRMMQGHLLMHEGIYRGPMVICGFDAHTGETVELPDDVQPSTLYRQHQL